MKNILSGYQWKIINLLTFSVISLIAKSFIAEFNVFQISFLFKLIALIITFVTYKIYYKRFPRIFSDYLSVLRAIINVSALALWFTSLQILEISNATIISYTTPLFGVFIGIILFREKSYKHIYYSLTIGIIGCYIVLQPKLHSHLIGIIACFGSAFLWSVHDSVIKIQTNRQHHVLESMFQSLLLTTLISSPIAGYYWEMPTFEVSSQIFICGVISFINLFSLGCALQKENLSLLMPVSFLRIIFVSIGGYLFYNEAISLHQAIGFFIILLSNYLILKSIIQKKRDAKLGSNNAEI